MVALLIRRGSLIPVALPGDYGNPALVIQADQFADHPTLTVLPMTSVMLDSPFLRVSVEPTEQNNLDHQSQVMVDKLMTLRKEKAGEPFGQIDAETMLAIERRLVVFLGIAK